MMIRLVQPRSSMLWPTSAVASRSLRLQRRMRLIMPRTPEQLYHYIRLVLGFDLPRTAMVAGHQAPFEYVQHAFFEDQSPDTRDCIVWANRGGGKTQIGAIATLLDLLFKPGIQIRILGGSFEQSSKMYGYLKRMLETEAFSDLIAGRLTGRHVELSNGSRVEVLSQSERAVRGQRVHKLRCDEVELFRPEIWEAAQLVTRSGRCGTVHVRAAIEALSTMHQPFGLMQQLVSSAAAQRRRMFRWNVMDTIEHCPPTRQCESCSLWTDCQGLAKQPGAQGFMHIEDVIQQRRRIGLHTWAAEMLCQQPDRTHSVYPEFDATVHVYDDADVPADIRSQRADDHCIPRQAACIAGVDFGYRDPTVMVLALLHEDGTVDVFDELVREQTTAEQFMMLADATCSRHGLSRPLWIGADPAGHQRSEQTGASTISLWRRAGWNLKTRVLPIEAGVDAVRRRLRRADGSIGLRVHRRCVKLIQALERYHYAADRPGDLTPVKDGPDHACDALRYMIVNLDAASRGVRVCRY